MKLYPLVDGSTLFHMANVFSGRLPTQVMIGLLEQTAYKGNNAKNPYNFVNAGLTRINITINGRSIPAVPYTPDYANNLFMREFFFFFGIGGLREIIPRPQLGLPAYECERYHPPLFERSRTALTIIKLTGLSALWLGRSTGRTIAIDFARELDRSPLPSATHPITNRNGKCLTWVF
jgi:hypothetical protein